ncbi:MAG: NAD(P)-dependent oxidoreductase [Phycisphaeraceae bacterium]
MSDDSPARHDPPDDEPVDAAPRPLTVLVTGSAGAVGRPVCKALRERGHTVRGLDRDESPTADEAIVANLADREAVAVAVRGVDAVVHLAAQPNDAPFLEELLPPNVVGLYHVMDAARAEGVARVVLASSVQAVGGIHRSPSEDWPVTLAEGTSPRDHYALTKAWLEQMGEMYARCYGMSVICARIGWMPRSPATVERMVQRGCEAHYVSPRDLGRFFSRAIEAEAIAFAILFATGPGTDQPLYDLTPGRQLVGYEPRDRFPEGLPFGWP